MYDADETKRSRRIQTVFHNRLLIALPLWCCLWASQAAEVARVRTATFGEIALHPRLAAPATVISDSEVEIGAEIAARIVELEPRVGQIVPRGEVIARLDCRDVEIDKRAAMAERDVLIAQRELAERRLVRARELEARRSLAVEVLDEREAEREVLDARIEGAETQIARSEVAIERCVITSPFDALLRSRLAGVGQYVAVGDPIARVVDVGELELSAQIDADDMARLNAASELVFESNGRRYAVRVRRAVAALDPLTRSREVRLEFSGEVPLLGSAGELVWNDGQAHLPGRLLVKRGQQLGAFLAIDGRARFHALPEAEAGRASAADLPPERVVVVEGHYGLEDGQPLALTADD